MVGEWGEASKPRSCWILISPEHLASSIIFPLPFCPTKSILQLELPRYLQVRQTSESMHYGETLGCECLYM